MNKLGFATEDRTYFILEVFGMKSCMQRFAVLVPIVFLVGCATSITMRERLLRDGYPPAYAEGFEVGNSCDIGPVCSPEWVSSINKEGRKDANRYAGDKSYAQGWVDGCERKCRFQQKELTRPSYDWHNNRLQQEFLKRNDD